jgi:type IV secretory pathway TrbF-like protein
MGKPLCETCGDRHEKWQAHKFVANEKPVANNVTNTVANNVTNTVANNPNSWRVKVWREANRERYNARERARMKNSRAKAKEKRDVEKANSGT